MQVDALALSLRRRPMAEAADLGALLVRRAARSVWRSFVPAWAAVVAAGFALFEVAPWAPYLVLFLCKPWLDRVLLFVLSRAAFAQATTWADVWAHRGPVLGRGLLRTFFAERLSPWRSFTRPVAQLESQTGGAGRKRRLLLLRGHRGSAIGMQFVFANVETAAMAAVLAAALWLAPKGTVPSIMTWLGDAGPGYWACFDTTYALVVLALEPFYVGAGFAMYLNRRVELEAWDLEQEFRLAFHG